MVTTNEGRSNKWGERHRGVEVTTKNGEKNTERIRNTIDEKAV